MSPSTEDHTVPKHQTIIRPQDVDTQLTSGLAALVQETSPLAPYKIQCSAKRKARQMLSNIVIDSFQDPSSDYFSKMSEIDSFQDHCVLHQN